MLQSILRGIDLDTYRKLLPELQEANRKNVLVLSAIAVPILAILFVVSFFVSEISFAKNIYLFGIVCYSMLFLLNFFLGKKIKGIIQPSTVLFIVSAFLIAIGLSYFGNREGSSTVYMVLLFVIPLLFNLRPITPAIIIAFCTALLIFTESKVKVQAAFVHDVVNAICFSFSSVIIGTYMMNIKLARYKVGVDKKETTEKMLQKSAEKIQKQTEILYTISGIYNSLHLVDLVNESVTAYSSNERVNQFVYDGGDIYNKMNNAITNLFIKEQQTEIHEFTDLSTIAERMKNKKYIFQDFKSVSAGWMRVAFIVNEVNEEGLPTQVIFTTLLIDDDKKREEYLYKQSKMDELTGMSNRRAYEEKLLEHKGEPVPEDLTVFAFDVNRLKQVNDTLGHAAGDELISGAAECILKVCREYGPTYRTGGDEFMALLQADSQTAAKIKLEFLKTSANWKGKLVQEMSVACGYATKADYPDAETLDLIRFADQQMYDDKRDFYVNSGLDRRTRKEN